MPIKQKAGGKKEIVKCCNCSLLCREDQGRAENEKIKRGETKWKQEWNPLSGNSESFR